MASSHPWSDYLEQDGLVVIPSPLQMSTMNQCRLRMLPQGLQQASVAHGQRHDKALPDPSSQVWRKGVRLGPLLLAPGPCLPA